MRGAALVAVFVSVSSLQANPDQLYAQLLAALVKFPDAYELVVSEEIGQRREEFNVGQVETFIQGLEVLSKDMTEDASIAQQGAVYGFLFGHSEWLFFDDEGLYLNLKHFFDLVASLSKYAVTESFFCVAVGIFAHFQQLGIQQPILIYAKQLRVAMELVNPFKRPGFDFVSLGACGAICALAMSFEGRFHEITAEEMKFINDFSDYGSAEDFVVAYAMVSRLIDQDNMWERVKAALDCARTNGLEKTKAVHYDPLDGRSFRSLEWGLGETFAQTSALKVSPEDQEIRRTVDTHLKAGPTPGRCNPLPE